MAVVLEALASYVQNMLMEMAKEEVCMLLGVPDKMNKMDVKLKDLKKFLVDADRRNITDASVQGWVQELKGAMYDATDILDLCQLTAMKWSSSRDMGCFNPLLFCMRHPLHAHSIGNRVSKLNEKLDDISKRGAAFNFINLTSYEERGGTIESTRLPSRETTGELILDVVGEKIEDDTWNLVELLTCTGNTRIEHNKVMVFAILGVGGIGKTTLAQNIFNNEIIQQKFDKKIWVSVNKHYSESELLMRTIEAGGGNKEPGNTKVVLEQTLKETLKGCKTLLVMDDVWNHRAWENVLKTPFTKASSMGSCVLITTRDYRVARSMKAEEPYHHVSKLEPEGAWSLLKKQVVRNKNDESQVDILKDIGMGILEKCDGLPLAVKVMGGLLRQKRTRQSDWENVLNDSIWSVSQMPEELNYSIYLSYQDMDPSLKPCFLHFSLLPKSTMFFVHDIVAMWIAEGFVHGGSRDLEELGREYYNELILRNLIEPNIKFINQRVCYMHDIVRSFAQYVARDEALQAHSNQTDIIDKLKSQKFIWLSLETEGSKSIELECMSLQEQSVRTLISVGPIKVKSNDSLATISNIRTLHVQDANFDSLMESFVTLKHLRYLSVKGTNISLLPENIGEMKLLQYISLLGCQSILKLPCSIGKLGHLRFLNLRGTRINSVPKSFSGLTNLRKLYGFPTQMDGGWCSLEELKPLGKLIELHINGLENIPSTLFVIKAGLFEKVHLRYLQLSCTNKNRDDMPSSKLDANVSNKGQQLIEEVFDELCPAPYLETLVINGYFGRRLPRWLMSKTDRSFGNLRFLGMEELPFCTELPDSLCLFSSLEVLQIKYAPAIKSVGPEFLEPDHHQHLRAPESLGSAVEVVVDLCSGLKRIGNLPKTQEVRIVNCPKLKILEGMPGLQRLDLGDYDMKTLPAYLRHVNPKHLLHIDCDLSLLTSMAAGKSGPEWDKFSHIKQVKAYANDDDNNIQRKWYVVYRTDPFFFKTNISRSAILRARKQHVWSAYSITCPTQEESAIGRVNADKCQPLCKRFRCNAYRHLVHWLHLVCQHCLEANGVATSPDQWTERASHSACRRVKLAAQQLARTQRK